MAKPKGKTTQKNSHEFKGKPVVQKEANESCVITRRNGQVVRDYFVDGKKVRTEACTTK